MRIKPLPPMNSLVAFEAAARKLSFTLAAKDLNVTQGAISRQIRLLETYLGQTLFRRANRSVSLTPTGIQYYQTICHALSDVAQATADIKQWQGAQKITIATTQAMAALWLLPRVTDFQRQYEDIDLRIVAMDQVLDWQQLDCDIALFYCRTPPAGLRVTPLFPERVFPVCSPAFLENQPKWNTAEALLATRRLCLDESQREWIGWHEWFTLLGLSPVKAHHENHLNNYPMLFQAAVNGQGLALAWESLVDDHLKSGALIKPLELVLETSASFCMLEPRKHHAPSPVVAHFRQWLLDQAAQQ